MNAARIESLFRSVEHAMQGLVAVLAGTLAHTQAQPIPVRVEDRQNF